MTTTAKLPDVLPGHWETPMGLEMAQRYAAIRRCELSAQNMADFEVANHVFTHPSIMNLTIAKDRIRWLSVQLAIAEADRLRLMAAATLAYEVMGKNRLASMDQNPKGVMDVLGYAIGQVVDRDGKK